MTLEETKKILMTANALFPAWKVENPEETIQAWHWALGEYTAESVMAAMQIFVKTRNSAFAPSPSELIDCMHAPSKHEQLSESEAWYMVKQAIQGANYNAEENYEKLPPIVQKAVGGSTMLRQWAMTDSDEVNTVIMSNFQRAYRALAEREQFEKKVPEQISSVVKGIGEKTDKTKAIEVKTGKKTYDIDYIDKRDNKKKIFKSNTDDVAEAIVGMWNKNGMSEEDCEILRINEVWNDEENA